MLIVKTKVCSALPIILTAFLAFGCTISPDSVFATPSDNAAPADTINETVHTNISEIAVPLPGSGIMPTDPNPSASAEKYDPFAPTWVYASPNSGVSDLFTVWTDIITLPGIDGTSTLGLYMDGDPKLGFVEEHEWAVVLKTSMGFFRFFPRASIRYSTLECEAFMDAVGNARVIIWIKGQSGEVIKEFVWNADKLAFSCFPVFVHSYPRNADDVYFPHIDSKPLYDANPNGFTGMEQKWNFKYRIFGFDVGRSQPAFSSYESATNSLLVFEPTVNEKPAGRYILLRGTVGEFDNIRYAFTYVYYFHEEEKTTTLLRHRSPDGVYSIYAIDWDPAANTCELITLYKQSGTSNLIVSSW